MRKIICLVCVWLLGTTCEAALFSGPALFSAIPSSQLGGITNNLIITNTANGFVVSGTVTINVAPSPPTQAGVLAAWTIDRPLDPLYAGPFILTTSTVLTGFSAPPIGAFQTTTGSVISEFSNVGGPSQSFIPMTLVNGIDSPNWNALTNTSTNFLYTPGVGNVLQQRFQLDGVYLAGPGGTWTIDVPVTTFVTEAPEPASLVLMTMAMAAGLRCRWRRPTFGS